MSDDKTKRGEPDRSTIDINDPNEVNYWCKKFKCTVQELKDAVRSAGKSAGEVEKYLKKNRAK
jgi:hypothetical protein